MAFWSDVGRNIGNFVGGVFGQNQKKKKDDQQSQNNTGSASITSAPRPPQAPLQLKAQAPQNLFQGINNDLRLPGSPSNTTSVLGNPAATVKPLTPQQPKPQPQPVQNTSAPKVQKPDNVFDNIRDFTAQANDALYGGLIRGGANIANSIGTGFNEKETQKRTNDFLRTTGISTNKDEQSNLARGTNKNSTAGQIGQAVGGTEKLVAENAPFIAMPGISAAEKLALVPKIGVNAGIGAGTGFLQGMGEGKSLKEDTKNAGIGAILGGGITAAAPAVSNLVKSAFNRVVPDAVRSRIINRALNTETPEETIGLTNLATTAEDANAPLIQTQQPRQISVSGVNEPTDIPVANNNTPRRPIVEVSGDTPGMNQVTVPTADERIAQRIAEQPKARPDTRIQGINNPAQVITRADKAEAQATLDDALKTGKIDENQHKDLSSRLKQIVAQDEPAPKGQKISVQEVKSIPVTDQTVVPTDLPETPGTVRVTDASAPTNEVSAQLAAGQRGGIVETPSSNLSKSQVASARNQRKLARQMAKTQEQTAEVITRIENAKNGGRNLITRENFGNSESDARSLAIAHGEALDRGDFDTAIRIENRVADLPSSKSPELVGKLMNSRARAQAGGNEGFVPTGEFGRSMNGGAYQKTNRAAEMQQAVQETANMSPGDVIQTARTNQASTGGFNRRDIRNIAALFEQKRIPHGTPEYNEARQILKEDGTIWGQTGALRNYTVRRTATPDELISRFESKIYRLADDPSKIDSRLFDQVDAAETKFADTRDAALQAYNRFTEVPTSANAKAYHAAQDAAEAADKEAMMTEYKVASQALKGNKDIQQARELEKMAQNADMYQMDAVDASMLSGTGTFVRNFVNATVGGAEEKLFGKVGARLASQTPNAIKNDVVVGGGTGFNGFGEGVRNIVDSSKARAAEAGANPLEHIKNWATTGNQLGDAVIDSQVKNNVLDHYTQLLKGEGYTGSELKNRAGVMARQDPNGVTSAYQQTARVAAGLGSGITRNNKIETIVKNMISDGLSGGNPNKYSEGAAKLITRMTLGFPTAIGRSVAEGAKRFTLGAPTFLKAMATQDPQTRALLIKEGIKQAGTGGAVIPPLFYALGASGAITGGYPSDPEERDRWTREGISENSIKIGDDYYQLPAYLGSWAIPGLFYASLGRNGGDWGAAAGDVAKAAPDLLPTGGIDSVLDVVNGRKPIDKYLSQLVPSAVRASTPGGALLNQLAKSFDPTQNDTNSGDAVSNFVDKVLTGIPGVANTLPDKTDAAGNTLSNPNPLALALGASSTSQQNGIDQTNQMNDQTNSTIDTLGSFGAFSDPNLRAVITDEKTKKIYNDIVNGKQVTPDSVKKLQEAMVKGVSASDDSAYLEKEQYDTNIAALNIKRSLMAADPTTKPSDLDNIDVAIKRGQVYKDNEVPYDLIKAYESTDLSDWRAMGNPEKDEYDPDMYQKLFTIDEMMTNAGVSYKKGDLTKPKYSAKASGGGRGGSKGFSTDFGTLKAGTGAPTVQQYETLDQRSGGVPIIQVQRPNIVHKIGFSG